MKTIEMYFELGSPYSYLAATQIEALAAKHGAEVVWKPVVLGAVFKATGNKPGAFIPAKGMHLFKDLSRWARQYELSITMPSAFPTNTVTAHRVVLAVSRLHGVDAGKEIAMHLFRTYWESGQDISDRDVLAEALTSAGQDAEAVLAATQDPEVKALLRTYTDEAIERSVFGAPTFFVGEEMFWGNDRLHHLELELEKG